MVLFFFDYIHIFFFLKAPDWMMAKVASPLDDEHLIKSVS